MSNPNVTPEFRKMDEYLARVYLGEQGFQARELATPVVELGYPLLCKLGKPSAKALDTIVMVANPTRALGTPGNPRTASDAPGSVERKPPKSGYYRCQMTRTGKSVLWDLNCYHLVAGLDRVDAKAIGQLEATVLGHRLDAVLSNLDGVAEAWQAFDQGLPNGSQAVLIVGHIEGFGREKTYQGEFGQGSVEKAFLSYAELYLMDRFLDRSRTKSRGTVAALAERLTRPTVQDAADLIAANLGANDEQPAAPERKKLVIG